MARQFNNSGNVDPYERDKKRALQLLSDELDREHGKGTYGSVTVETTFENGEIKHSRRVVNAVHK